MCTVSVRHMGILVTWLDLNGPRAIFKKQNFLQGLISDFYFYKDQNLNESYLQGRVQYLSQLHLMHQHGTYKTFSDRSCIRKSGKEPFKLLFDKSLKKSNLNVELQVFITNKERIISKLNGFGFIII